VGEAGLGAAAAGGREANSACKRPTSCRVGAAAPAPAPVADPVVGPGSGWDAGPGAAPLIWAPDPAEPAAEALIICCSRPTSFCSSDTSWGLMAPAAFAAPPMPSSEVWFVLSLNCAPFALTSVLRPPPGAVVITVLFGSPKPCAGLAPPCCTALVATFALASAE